MRCYCRRWSASGSPTGRNSTDPTVPYTHVYFPQKGCLSSVVHVEEGRVECGAVGNEGMLGVQVYLGLDFSPIRSVVQIPGPTLRMPAAPFLRAAKPGSALANLVRRYIGFYLRFVNQSVACNSFHPVEERMSKWLLMAEDWAGEDTFLLTQEYLAEMIGARRQTVSMVAGTLKSAGLIRYQRGTMQVVNRQGLEAASCECYDVLKRVYHRVMGDGREDLSSGPTLSPLAHAERLSSVPSHS
jgi:hypothetical protein